MIQDVDRHMPELADTFLAIAGLALAREADGPAMSMVEAARRLRPAAPLLDAFDGWFCLRGNDLVGATRHLTVAVETLGAQSGSARTLLAMVLCAQGEPAWLAQAQLVIDEGLDPHGIYLMKSLMGDGSAQAPVAAAAGAGPGPGEAAAPAVAAPQDRETAASSPTASTRDHRRMFIVRG